MDCLGNDGGDDTVKNPNVDFADTQLLDSQFSPGEGGMDADELCYFEDTEPFDHTVPCDEAFDTQLLNLHGETQMLNFCGETQPVDLCGKTQHVDFCGETQVMNLDGETQPIHLYDETQAMNLDGETQPIHLYDETQATNLDCETQILEYPDCIGNMDTQLLDEFNTEVALDSDDEGTDKTEVLSYNDELSDDDITRWNNGQSDYQEKRQSYCLHKHNDEGEMEQADVLIDNQHSSGSAAMVFTSLRAKSLRAAGPAAHDMALKLTNSESHLEKHATDNDGVPCLRGSPAVGKEVIQEQDKGNCNENGKRFSSEGKSRIASSAVRKLFIDEDDKESSYNGNTSNEGEEFIHPPACNDNVSGLSYVDSQEPGDLSQTKALDFVDKFLKTSTLEFDQDTDLGKYTRGKSKPLSNAKGPQSLAKLAKEKLAVKGRGVFDWDDNREDERGGEIFSRKKGDFYDGRSHRKSCCRTEKAKSSTVNKQRDRLVHSDSRLMMHGVKGIKKGAKVAQLNLKRDLANEFDEHLNVNVSKGQLETAVNDTNVPEIPDIRFDTQMAAEVMEGLCHGEDLTNGACQGTENNLKVTPDGDCRGNIENSVCSKQLSSRTRECPSNIGVATRQSKKRIGAEFCTDALITSEKRSKNVKKQVDIVLVTQRSAWSQSSRRGNLKKVSSKDSEQRNARVLKRSHCGDGGVDSTVLRTGVGLTKKRDLQGKGITMSVAKRTRHSLAKAQCTSSGSEEEKDLSRLEAHEEKRTIDTGIKGSSSSKAKEKYSLSGPNQSGSTENEQSDPKFCTLANDIRLAALSYPKRKRSCRNTADQVNGYNSDAVSKLSARQGDIGQYINGWKGSDCNSMFNIDFGTKSKTRSSSYPNVSKLHNLVENEGVKRSEKKVDADSLSAQENVEATTRLYESPGEKSGPPVSASVTPTSCKTPVHDASPVCTSNEYYRQLCKRTPSRSCLMREIRSLSSTASEHTPVLKDLRKRRDMADVRVLYSHHLDDDIIKQQKKILARFGVPIASSVSDATHFIADKFVRTKNMLEAIASGKPVVTHLWVESCGQANCFIDEKRYILRDAKKEREFGFSMPVSLARANQCPLLQGRKVFITPNTKPGTEIISNLVRAVDGQAVERIGRSILKDGKVPDDLLVLSCEEDEALCVPFLEKGAAVYSSELLLNGIVTQRLDYGRHRLFADDVKRTRSTTRMRKDGNTFQPVAKQKK